MTRQSELALEEQLIKQLNALGHSSVDIKDEQSLLANFKTQLEKHNQVQLSDKEFKKVLNILNRGTVFERAKILRGKQQIERDNGESLYFEFINQEQWCQF